MKDSIFPKFEHNSHAEFDYRPVGGLTKRELFLVIGAAAHAVAHLGNRDIEILTAQDCYKGGKAFADGIIEEMTKAGE